MDEFKLSYQTLREQVALLVKEKILNGEIPPGEKINENRLACQLGISRGPVREALRQIEQEGLVTYTQNRGCTVAVLTAVDMEEMYLVRSTLEALAVRICGGRLTAGSFEVLRSAVGGMVLAAEAADLKSAVECDQMFHGELVLAAGKKRLHALWSTTDGANVATYFTMNSAGMMPYSELAHSHQILLDALLGGDVEDICAKINEHYLAAPNYLLKREGR